MYTCRRDDQEYMAEDEVRAGASPIADDGPIRDPGEPGERGRRSGDSHSPAELNIRTLKKKLIILNVKDNKLFSIIIKLFIKIHVLNINKNTYLDMGFRLSFTLIS